jgi:nucleotide-binding universal stress UspA family protein
MARVVVGVDGSDYSRRAFRRAREEAALRNATFEAVFVYAPPHKDLGTEFGTLPYASSANEPAGAADQRAQQAREKAHSVLAEFVRSETADQNGPAARQVVIPGDHPAETLMGHAANADLLVIGTRGRGGFRGMLAGSVALQLVQHATCPLLILPPDMTEAPA